MNLLPIFTFLYPKNFSFSHKYTNHSDFIGPAKSLVMFRLVYDLKTKKSYKILFIIDNFFLIRFLPLSSLQE